MALARHSDPKLTMKRYGKPQLHDLGAKIERLPSLRPTGLAAEPVTLSATRTDGAPACTKLAQANDSKRDRAGVGERIGSAEGANATRPETPVLSGIGVGR